MQCQMDMEGVESSVLEEGEISKYEEERSGLVSEDSNQNGLESNCRVGLGTDGSEDDGFKNIQVNFNGEKWINDNLKFKSTLYTRSTQADYDGSSTSEENYFSV